MKSQVEREGERGRESQVEREGEGERVKLRLVTLTV